MSQEETKNTESPGLLRDLTAATAETKRTPFDLPEGESEIIGYFVEYSGMKFGMFYFADFIETIMIAALAATLFLGGWQVPPVTDHPVLLGILQFVVFFLKAYFWVFVAMWVRGTLPRVRVDQLMSLCWKYMVPLSFICLLGTAAWMVIWPKGNRVASVAMFLLGMAILALFVKRVNFQIRHARPEIYLKPYI